uniref:Lipase n=1 Tax=Glossina morsitans morsitans TaxID=37546 RepID=A0A1B0G8S8_GLOMM
MSLLDVGMVSFSLLILLLPLNRCFVDTSFVFHTKSNREVIITDAMKRIHHDGFPVEQHNVQTKDGYVLTLHRIPCRQRKLDDHVLQKRPVVLLMAGIYASSDVWLLNGAEDSLPYLLSNNGYDVWLGNNRGNIYARHNIWYNDTQPEFWNFSWHEMSIYDLPAMIDFIRACTGEERMHFIGISQGGTIFLVLNSMLPQYNKHFKTAVLLAPVTYVGNTKAPLAKLFGPLLGTRNYISKILEGVEMVSTNKYVKKFLSMTCLKSEPPRACVSRLWPAVGYNTQMLNLTLLPDLMANFPVGGSFKQLMHYFQGYMSKNFRQYDYGREMNWLRYHQLEPPAYQLQKVTVPVILFFAQNDYIIALEDMFKLIKHLPNVKMLYKLPPKYWNHFDFICGLRVREFIYNKVIDEFNFYEYHHR